MSRTEGPRASSRCACSSGQCGRHPETRFLSWRRRLAGCRSAPAAWPWNPDILEPRSPRSNWWLTRFRCHFCLNSSQRFGRSTPLSRIDPSRSTLKFFSPVLDRYPHDLWHSSAATGTVSKLVGGYFGRMLNASPRFIVQTRSARARSR